MPHLLKKSLTQLIKLVIFRFRQKQYQNL